jgi:hypothetical protein
MKKLTIVKGSHSLRNTSNSNLPLPSPIRPHRILLNINTMKLIRQPLRKQRRFQRTKPHTLLPPPPPPPQTLAQHTYP